MGTDSMGLAVTQKLAQGVYSSNLCHGFQLDLTSSMSAWWTDNASIATAAGAYITGVAPGATPQLASGTVPVSGFRQCSTLPEQSQGGTNVCKVPTSAATSLTDPLSLSSVYPNLLSGIGNVARVTVSPTGTSWDGQSVTEAASTGGTNTCPSGFPTNVCSGNTTFTIGAGYQPAVKEGTNTVDVGPLLVGTTNEFFDQYSVTSSESLLDANGGGSSCQITCSQQYFNACTTPQQLGDHTFTYTFTKSTISGTKVTLVTVSE